MDNLPYLAINLGDAPEPLLRKLFEVTQLDIRLRTDSDVVSITITLPANEIPTIADAAANDH